MELFFKVLAAFAEGLTENLYGLGLILEDFPSLVLIGEPVKQDV